MVIIAKVHVVVIGVIVVVLALGAFGLSRLTKTDNANFEPDYIKLAKCLTENGVTMYGSKTCPHCSTQKEAFGKAFEYINYVECTEQREVCSAHEIQYLPTWEFADGNKMPGKIELAELGLIAGCEI